MRSVWLRGALAVSEDKKSRGSVALTKHARLTVHDLRKLKGKRQLTMLFVETPEEAAAASAAGIDILSIVEHLWSPSMREAAGDCFVQVGLIYGQHCTYEDYLRAAHKNLMMGGDAFYCAGSLDTITKLAAEGIPVVGHVGLIPARATWSGGFTAVGKTAAEAMHVYHHVRQLEAAGAVAAEIEVVPARVASEIAKRTTLVLMSMGAGSGCDAQYLFAEDVLGYSRGHQPRHAKVYRNFRAEYDRLQQERIAAFQEFRADVEKGAFPQDKHLVPIADAEFEMFVKGLETR
jgi:3-methyl-2-oxobutanoate hydroxymethyltransferase